MWAVALVVLGGTGFIGVRNGITERVGAVTTMQKAVTAGVFLYGVLGIVAAIGLAMRRRWSVPVTLAWLVVLTFVAGGATFWYGEAGIGAAIAASVSTALIAAGVLWMTHAVTREGR